MSILSRPDRDKELWRKWNANKSPENLRILLKAIDPIINSEVQKQLGTIPPPVLKLKAKSLVIKALSKYDPSKAQLNTFIVHQLAPLKRENMKAQNIIRMPENMQLKVRTFIDTKQKLEDKLRREPTSLELADELKWSLKQVRRMEKQFHTEANMGSLTYEEGASYLNSALNLRTDLVFRSLSPRDQLIFEYTTGYGGKQKISNNAIAAKLKVSSAYISQRKKHIMKKLKEAGI
jgi:DNA-directed RNA polymerase specialized sigma subunit